MGHAEDASGQILSTGSDVTVLPFVGINSSFLKQERQTNPLPLWIKSSQLGPRGLCSCLLLHTVKH